MEILSRHWSRIGRGWAARQRWTLLIAVALIYWLAPNALAQSREYQLKAAFVFNFAQFTDFPTNAFPSTESPLVIAVLGENPFGNTLETLVKGEKIAGRAVEVRYCERLREIEGAHVVFLAKSHWGTLNELLREVRGKPVLTISEMETFARKGGLIRLFLNGNKIEFNINPDAAKRAGLNLSSKLLRLATIVRDEQDE